MSCFKKNSGHRGVISRVGFVVIITVFFITYPCVKASCKGHRAENGKIITPSDNLDMALYDTNKLKKEFDRMDINSDGCLTVTDYKPDRFKLALLAAIPCYREMISALVLESQKKWYAYAGLDTNSDGQVDFKEFIVPQDQSVAKSSVQIKDLK